MLSDNIKNLRKQKGYTQETLAQALNIVRQTQSELYTQDEINTAIEVIKREFENWNGCKLHLIYYAGDDVCAEETKNRGVQTMVLLSDFTAVNPGGDSGLNSNHTYHNWNWILIKNEKGQWEHIDHGY